MSKKKQGPPAVGFPPPLLGEAPLRLPILGQGPGWLALEKPAGVGTRAHPWNAGTPDLDAALNQQLQAEKPELLRLEASLFGSVYYLDPEISGVALFAKNRAALADLRDHFGSREGNFRFCFVAGPAGDGAKELTSGAPLLPHRTKPKMIPSTAKGKKCETNFREISRAGAWVLWEARCNFFRPHQVRAHAAVAGIAVLGDELYGAPAIPKLTDLIPGSRRRSAPASPAFSGLPIRLAETAIKAEGSGPQVCSPPDKSFSLFIRRLGLESESPE